MQAGIACHRAPTVAEGHIVRTIGMKTVLKFDFAAVGDDDFVAVIERGIAPQDRVDTEDGKMPVPKSRPCTNDQDGYDVIGVTFRARCRNGPRGRFTS